MTGVLRFAVLLLMALLLAGCPGDEEEGTTSGGTTTTTTPPSTQPSTEEPEPAIGTVHVGTDQCEYVYTGNGSYTPGNYCYQDYGNGVIGVWRYNNRQQRYAKYDTTTPGYLTTYPESLGRWIRSPTNQPSQIEVRLDDGSWVSWAQYQQMLAQQRIAAENAKQRELAELGRRNAQLEVGKIQQRMIEANKIWTLPECNFSYNGCS